MSFFFLYCNLLNYYRRTPNGFRFLHLTILYGKDAEWHVLPSSMGVTAKFITLSIQLISTDTEWYVRRSLRGVTDNL